MKKTVTALRVATLLGAMCGASALLVAAATPAKAAEERLHGSSYQVYGLIPLGESNRGATSPGSMRASGTDTKTTSKTGTGKGNKADDEPQLEDPPLPPYDGPNGGSSTLASNEGGTPPGFN